LIYFCDDKRHLICYPYTEENLHEMAKDLGIKKCWFHRGKFMHYDIPKKRIEEITIHASVLKVKTKYLLKVIKLS
jgi:FMN phosphatase YigB (HAD superfamily)